MPRAFSSFRRSQSTPVSALTSVVLPWSMWPAVPMIMVSGDPEEGVGSGQCGFVSEDGIGGAALAPQRRHELHAEEFGAQAVAVEHRLGAFAVAAGADHPQALAGHFFLEIDTGHAQPAAPVVEVGFQRRGNRKPINRR